VLVDPVAMPLTGTSGRRVRLAAVSIVAFITAVPLAACGGDEGMSNDNQDETGTDMADDHGDAGPVGADARHVEVAARSFAFDPDEITVSEGEDIAIVLMSEDGLHDFTLDDFDAHVAAEAGETGFGGFRAGDPGRYTFYCSVEGHREQGMDGVLVVEG